MLKILKSIIYPSANLEEDKNFWMKITGTQPYFDQPFYVGFNINGCELGLDPNAYKEGINIPVAYWGVDNIEHSCEKFLSDGATLNTGIKAVGEGIKMATLKDSYGNIFGIIENPNS